MAKTNPSKAPATPKVAPVRASRAKKAGKAPKAQTTPPAPEVETPSVPPTPQEPAQEAPQEAQGEVKDTRPVGYYLPEGFRPSAGDRLAAHTSIFLERFGLMEGKAVPTDIAKLIIGARAIKWHLTQGNFVTTRDGIKLTNEGITNFGKRAINLEYKAAYEAVLIDGQCNDTAGVKNPAFIKKLA